MFHRDGQCGLMCLVALIVGSLTTSSVVAQERCLPVVGGLEPGGLAFWDTWRADGPKPRCQTDDAVTECLWIYDLADPNGLDHFAVLRDTLVHCLGDEAVLWEDTGVNHPDAYQAIGLRLSDTELSLSFKRKTALGQSRITYRSSPRD